MNRHMGKESAKTMMDAAVLMSTITGLINDNADEELDDEGRPFLNGYRLNGLMRALDMASHLLADRSEWMEEAVDKEEKLAQAALARRQGRDDHRESNVGAECGTQRAA